MQSNADTYKRLFLLPQSVTMVLVFTLVLIVFHRFCSFMVVDCILGPARCALNHGFVFIIARFPAKYQNIVAYNWTFSRDIFPAFVRICLYGFPVFFACIRNSIINPKINLPCSSSMTTLTDVYISSVDELRSGTLLIFFMGFWSLNLAFRSQTFHQWHWLYIYMQWQCHLDWWKVWDLNAR